MTDWSLADLEAWDDAVRDVVDSVGLDCYPQEFELCDHEDMLGYMAYHGMPSHYGHWSYGKAFERQKALYDHGVSGLPYELVINSDPCLAYLMRDNSLCLQILTIAHVYGHNDFFKNNFTFTSATDADETLAAFKARSDRLRRYVEDPSIGEEAVERMLDDAHALAMTAPRNAAIRAVDEDERRAELLEKKRSGAKNDGEEGGRRETDLERLPIEPVDDILAFLRDHCPHLAEWQRDILEIVRAEAVYFMPQIDTKIMNEGWASHWHHRIMQKLDLPEAERLEFMVRHNQVVCPHPGSLNPYHLGYEIWRDIEERLGEDAMFAARECDRDSSFLRRFLHRDLMEKLDLFSWDSRGEHQVVTDVSDEEGWESVKNRLLRNVGSASFPHIRVLEAQQRGHGALVLEHRHDGRDLDIVHTEKTLGHLHRLWRRDVRLRSSLRGTPMTMTFSSEGFDATTG